MSNESWMHTLYNSQKPCLQYIVCTYNEKHLRAYSGSALLVPLTRRGFSYHCWRQKGNVCVWGGWGGGEEPELIG